VETEKKSKYKNCEKKEETGDFSTISPYRAETMLGIQEDM
jgi:hypothetical protein